MIDGTAYTAPMSVSLGSDGTATATVTVPSSLTDNCDTVLYTGDSSPSWDEALDTSLPVLEPERHGQEHDPCADEHVHGDPPEVQAKDQGSHQETEGRGSRTPESDPIPTHGRSLSPQAPPRRAFRTSNRAAPSPETATADPPAEPRAFNRDRRCSTALRRWTGSSPQSAPRDSHPVSHSTIPNPPALGTETSLENACYCDSNSRQNALRQLRWARYYQGRNSLQSMPQRAP